MTVILGKFCLGSNVKVWLKMPSRQLWFLELGEFGFSAQAEQEVSVTQN